MKSIRIFFLLLIYCVSAVSWADDTRYSEAQCERINARLEKINSQLRYGARAKKVENLKDRRRALKLERSQHCNP